MLLPFSMESMQKEQQRATGKARMTSSILHSFKKYSFLGRVRSCLVLLGLGKCWVSAMVSAVVALLGLLSLALESVVAAQ